MRPADALGAALVLLGTACGYHALNGAQGGGLHVHLASSRAPDAIASEEVLIGVREELAREGALSAGEGYPRLEVEVLREDETSDGIASPSPALGAGAGGAPRARGVEVGVVARAWILRDQGGAVERDTGDVRAMDLVASELRGGVPDSRVDAFQHADALRAAARRVGRRLAQRVLGHPASVDEATGRER